MSVSTESQLAAELRATIVDKVTHSLGRKANRLTPAEVMQAVALAVRDQIIEGMLETEDRYLQHDAKRLYYLSMEFLIGRSLGNNLTNLMLVEPCRQALAALGFDLNQVEEAEVDAGLGNGGLGRLAACFLDSLATLNLPGFGYGINYEYGMFKQEMRGGDQVEKPDNWRIFDSPWLIERPRDRVFVPVYGRIEHSYDRDGNYNPMWLDWRLVIGVPSDMPIVGYGGNTVNYLRLFSARASQEVDMGIFNAGDYVTAVRQKVMSETISKILYPSESVLAGKELRLVQEYFLVACSIRDMIRRFEEHHSDFTLFSDKVAVQLNDTHPALAVAELMRFLIDERGLPWGTAWKVTQGTLAYTNHTLLPEALEKWPVSLFERVLPRHLQIIYEINQRFLDQVSERFPGDANKLRRVSIIEEGDEKQVRMANLAIVGSHSVNGVAALHSRLVQTDLVPDFYEMWPERFNNKTNGVTPRRWICHANRGLAELITECIGDEWITDLQQVRKLEAYANDAAFQERFRYVKRTNKQRMAMVVKETVGLVLDCDSLFGVQIKRIHEYKRQLLNALHIVYDYLRIVDQGIRPLQPRTYLIAGKAAPGYARAKQIIRFISDIASKINHDPVASPWMKVAFVPDYRVSLAEVMIPSADLSVQISTAGTEASGTGNMKFAMNGALTIGTLDGANIEMREQVGEENFFIFGHTVEEVQAMKARGSYRPRDIYDQDDRIRMILDAIRDDRFARSARDHEWIYHTLLSDNEHYFHVADLGSYLASQQEVASLYENHLDWAHRAVLNVARMGKFSSDRTIGQYADEIWGLRPIPSHAPLPATPSQTR